MWSTNAVRGGITADFRISFPAFSKTISNERNGDRDEKKESLIERRARETFGRSIQELLEEIRIRIACSYLSATDRTVTQISSDVGFGSISSFQRSFSKYMNQTPSEYRRFHQCK